MLFNKLRRAFGAPPLKGAPGRAEPRRDGRSILGLSMMKNEQDIIEPFIRHHARLLDALVVLDNASLDETRRIAMDCARELGNVVVADSEEFGYAQAERMTRLLHACQSAYFADFVLFLDADEFLSAPDRGALLGHLGAIPPGGVGHLPWRTFVLKPGETAAATPDPPRSFRWRRSAETPEYRKAALRLDGAYRPDLRVAQGNHDVLAGDAGERLPSVELDGLPLLHFPVRSREQIVAKGVVGWMAYLAMNPRARASGLGFQWRDAFDRVAEGGTAAVESGLGELSLRYAQDRAAIDWDGDVVRDQAPSDYDRRYSSGASADPVAVIARSWERSLVPTAPVLRLERPPEAATAAAGATGTSFDAAWHWDHLFVDVPPFRFLAEKHRPASVLDVGCGIGAYLALFKRFGAAAVVGLDGVPPEATASVLEPGEYAVRDLAEPLRLDRVFDLVLCVEVAEHLEERHSGTLLDSIARHAGGAIVFSAAEPGQPGHGHINCQPISQWLDRWAERGWVPDLSDSLAIRGLATMSWFRRNLVVLRRGDPAEAADATAALAAIGARAYAWYAQLPGIRLLPFSELASAPLEGYGAGPAPGSRRHGVS